jgi:hypothetical protein
MARGLQPLIHLDPAEDRNIYSNNPDDLARQALDISTNFFGDRVELYKNFINSRVAN